MTQDHPFAPYVRILGKGPNLSRPLTQDEARAAMGMILRGEALPVQVGAFLCLLRVKTETPQEAAGLAQGIRDHLAMPADLRADVDWASYAGKSRRLPYYLLAALALAQSGVRVFMHGAEHHTAGRVYATEALAALGITAATSPAEAAARLDTCNFAYITLDHLSPPLQAIMDLKPILGLRSPLHTVARMANPSGAPFAVNGVTHPPYLPVHQDSALLLGQRFSAAFKGDGGEAERRPEKPCEAWAVADGTPVREEWPALVDGVREKEDLELARLGALWRGDAGDDGTEAAIAGTIAIVLRYSGRARSVAEAEAAGRALWQGRDRTRVPGAV